MAISEIIYRSLKLINVHRYDNTKSFMNQKKHCFVRSNYIWQFISILPHVRFFFHIYPKRNVVIAALKCRYNDIHRNTYNCRNKPPQTRANISEALSASRQPRRAMEMSRRQSLCTKVPTRTSTSSYSYLYKYQYLYHRVLYLNNSN
jgi:hypothetical protein